MSGIKLVGKIGSMALIQRRDNDIDYNIFSRIGKELEPGMVWVSSGATEIGRLDYIRRMGKEPVGDSEEIKSDYAAQGQQILMENYRRFINPSYSVRQLLVEHTHFNDNVKCNHILNFLKRSASQGAIPIVNYNDPVSFEENRNVELSLLSGKNERIVECIDNDETAAIIAELVGAPLLLILTSVEGIYKDANDSSTIIEEILSADAESLSRKIDETIEFCNGTSREGSGGAAAKLKYVKDAAMSGTQVIIGHARHGINDLIEGRVKCTRIGLK